MAGLLDPIPELLEPLVSEEELAAMRAREEQARREREAAEAAYAAAHPPEPEREWYDYIRDPALMAAEGVIDTGESAVGLLDLATKGYAGKALDYLGYDPDVTREFIASGYSDAQQEANRRVEEASGLLGTLDAIKDNPSTALRLAIRSAPSMVGGMAAGKLAAMGVSRVAPLLAGRIAPYAYMAAGEGLTMAGSQAEQLRRENADRGLHAKDYAAATTTGVAGAGVGVLGARAAKAMGVETVDTVLANLAFNEGRTVTTGTAGEIGKQAVKKLGLGTGIEVAEEIGQTIPETAARNWATGKPLTERMGEDVGNAIPAAMLMGGGANAASVSGSIRAGRKAQKASTGLSAEVKEQLENIKTLGDLANLYKQVDTREGLEALRQAALIFTAQRNNGIVAKDIDDKLEAVYHERREELFGRSQEEEALNETIEPVENTQSVKNEDYNTPDNNEITKDNLPEPVEVAAEEAPITLRQDFTPEQMQEKRERLRSNVVANVEKGVFQRDRAKEAIAAIKRWVKEEINGRPMETEIGRVYFQPRGVKDSFGHSLYPQKVDLTLAVPDVLERGEYLGSMKDIHGRDIDNHYFAGKVKLGDEEHFLFIRARQKEKNSKRFYVHEVFTEEEVKKSGSLSSSIDIREQQATAADKRLPDFYKSIIGSVLNVNEETSPQELTDIPPEPAEAVADTENSLRKPNSLPESYQQAKTLEELDKASGAEWHRVANEHSGVVPQEVGQSLVEAYNQRKGELESGVQEEQEAGQEPKPAAVNTPEAKSIDVPPALKAHVKIFGDVDSRKNHIERLVERGFTPQEKDGKRVLSDGSSVIGEDKITAEGFAYAEALRGKKAAPEVQAPDHSEHSETHSEHKESHSEHNKLDAPGKSAAPKTGTEPTFTRQNPADIPKGSAGNVAPESLSVDPGRFQYKLDAVGEDGVTAELKESKRYNPDLGGVISIWTDPEDGKSYVVNGHHRYELAKRSGYKGDLLVRQLKAETAEEARTLGAIINIAEGRGTATDAAKIFRDSGLTEKELKEKHDLSLSGAIARQGVELSHLSDPLFAKVVDGELSPARGAIIGRHLTQAADQMEVYKAAKKLKNAELEEVALIAKTAARGKSNQLSLFGENPTVPLLRETAQIRAYIKGQYAKTRNAMKAVAGKQREEVLSDAGNKLNSKENSKRLNSASKAIAYFDVEASSVGEVNSAIKTYAEQLHDARTTAEQSRVKREAFNTIDGILQDQQGEVQGAVQRGGSDGTRRASDTGKRKGQGGVKKSVASQPVRSRTVKAEIGERLGSEQVVTMMEAKARQGHKGGLVILSSQEEAVAKAEELNRAGKQSWLSRSWKSERKKLSRLISKFKQDVAGQELNEEQAGIKDVVTGEAPATKIRKGDLETLKEYVELIHGGIGRNKGAVHILVDHYSGKRGVVTAQEILDVGEVIRKGKIAKTDGQKRVYTLYRNGTRFRVVVGEHKGKDTLITFYSDRKSGTETGLGHNASRGDQSRRLVSDSAFYDNITEDFVEVKTSEDGSIQGFTDGTTTYLVEDGIADGKAWDVLLHEMGSHMRKLLLNDAAFQNIQKQIKERQNEKSRNGEAIRAAIERAEGDKGTPHYWEEVVSYMVEDSPEAGLVRRIIARVKALVHQAFGPRIAQHFKMNAADLRALSQIAVRREAKQAQKEAKTQERDALQEGKDQPKGFLYSMAETLGVSKAQLEREYKAVEARYKGTDQWMKAPNGEPTNLNERQWVLVRTPRFKAWFGNWEMNRDKRIAAIQITDRIFNGDRKAAQEWLTDPANGIEGTHTNEETGMDIVVSRRVLKRKATSGDALKKSGTDLHYEVARAIPKIITDSSLVSVEPDKNNSEFTLGVYKFVAPVNIEGETFTVKMTVKDRFLPYNQAVNNFYTHELVEIEMPSTRLRGEGIPLTRKADGKSALSVGEMIDAVNKKESGAIPEASGVVDENGEPLVVYHGTPNAGHSVFYPASFFTTNREMANKYSGFRTSHIDNYKGRKKKPESIIQELEEKSSKAVYPAFLNIKKTFDIDSLTKDKKEVLKLLGTDEQGLRKALIKTSSSARAFAKFPDFDPVKYFLDYSIGLSWQASSFSHPETLLGGWGKEAVGKELQAVLKELGFDGITLIDDIKNSYGMTIDEGKTFIPLSSTQIKSATGNTGAFDGSNPDIRFSRAKQERLEKLKNSKPVEITGKEIPYSTDIKQYVKNALVYGKEEIRGVYTNKDTGKKIEVARQGLKEVLQHNYKDNSHLQSVAAIPQIIESGIYLTAVPNENVEKKPSIKNYEYYAVGLKIGGEDYTVKFVVAETTMGNKYYDHHLTEIEKGDLLSIASRITSPEIGSNNALSRIEDKRLLQILQEESPGGEVKFSRSKKKAKQKAKPQASFHGLSSPKDRAPKSIFEAPISELDEEVRLLVEEVAKRMASAVVKEKARKTKKRKTHDRGLGIYSSTLKLTEELSRAAAIEKFDGYERMVASLKNDALDIVEKQRMLADYIRKFPREVRGTYGLASVPHRIAMANTEAKRLAIMLDAVSRIDKTHEAHAKRTALAKLKKLVKKNAPKKQGDTIKGNKTKGYELVAEMQKIQAVLDLSEKEYEEKLETALKSVAEISEQPDSFNTEEERETANRKEREEFIDKAMELRRLQVFGNLKNRSAAEAQYALEQATGLTQDMLTEWREELARIKEARQREREIIADEISGGKKPKNEDERKADKDRQEKAWAVVLDALNTFDNNHQSFETLLDKLASLSGKGSLESHLVKKYARMVHDATVSEQTAIREKMAMFCQKQAEIYGIKKGGKTLLEKIRENSQTQEKTGVFRRTKEVARDKEGNALYDENKRIIFEKEPKKTEIRLSQNKAAKRWMEWQDVTLREQLEKQGYTAETINEIEGFMKPEVKKWAEWQLEFYREYYDEVNDIYRDVFYADMPKGEGYSPTRRLYNRGEEDADLTKKQSKYSDAIPGGIKARVSNNREILPQDCDTVLMRHIADMEHFIAWAKPMRELRGVLGSEQVNRAIKEYHGVPAQKLVTEYLDAFSAGRTQTGRYGLIEKLRASFTTAAIGLNDIVFMKQLTSIPAYAVEIPVAKWLKYMPRTPQEVWEAKRFLEENSELMKNRYFDGFERDMMIAMGRDSARALSGRKKLADKLMFFTKMGDKTAIIIGGYPVYRYHFEQAKAKGMSEAEAKKFAIQEFELATDRTQQAGNLKDLSHHQMGNSIERLFTMFITSPMQYYRQTGMAVRDLARDNKESKRKAAKRLFIFNVVLPVMFQAVAGAGEDDLWGYMKAIFLGPFNGLFMLREFASPALNFFTGEPVYGTPGTPPIFETYNDMQTFARAVKRYTEKPLDEWAFDEDFWEVVVKGSRFIGPITGLPTYPVVRWAEGIWDAAQGDTVSPVRRALGFSERTLDKDKAHWDDLRKEIKRSDRKESSRYRAMRQHEKAIKALEHRVEMLLKYNGRRSQILKLRQEIAERNRKFVDRWG